MALYVGFARHWSILWSEARMRTDSDDRNKHLRIRLGGRWLLRLGLWLLLCRQRRCWRWSRLRLLGRGGGLMFQASNKLTRVTTEEIEELTRWWVRRGGGYLGLWLARNQRRYYWVQNWYRRYGHGQVDQSRITLLKSVMQERSSRG